MDAGSPYVSLDPCNRGDSMTCADIDRYIHGYDSVLRAAPEDSHA